MGVKHATLQGHFEEVTDVQISRDGKWILSSSEDDSLRRWSRVNGKCVGVYEGHMGGIYACAFSRDSKFGASASWDKTVKVWDFEKEPDESCVATFQGHTGRVLCCSFSPCQTYVLSGSKDATLRVWSVERLCGSNRIDGTRSAATAEEGAGEEEQKRCVGILRGHTSRVHSCAFSPSSGIAASASGDCTVRLWDVSTSTCLSQFVAHTDSVLRCVFSESGKFLMTASQDKNVKIWDLTKIGECVRTIRCTAKMSKYRNKYWGAIHGCAWSISSKLIVCGGTDRNVHVHDRTTGRHICALPGHGNSITCTAFSTTGYFLCTGSKDMTVRIWFLPKSMAKHAGSLITSRQLIALWPRLSRMYGGWHQYPAQIIRRISEF